MLPNGVTVAQLILVQFVLVRIQVGQPFFSLGVLAPAFISACMILFFLSVQ